jgi:serine/threonine-protein phosphatase 2A regulatory subunit B'
MLPKIRLPVLTDHLRDSGRNISSNFFVQGDSSFFWLSVFPHLTVILYFDVYFSNACGSRGSPIPTAGGYRIMDNDHELTTLPLLQKEKVRGFLGFFSRVLACETVCKCLRIYCKMPLSRAVAVGGRFLEPTDSCGGAVMTAFSQASAMPCRLDASGNRGRARFKSTRLPELTPPTPKLHQTSPALIWLFDPQSCPKPNFAGPQQNTKKRFELCVKKLDQCSRLYDYSITAESSSLVQTAKSKSIKTAALNDVIRYVTQKPDFMDAELFPHFVSMISRNIIRPLAPEDDPTAAPYDPEDDEPRLEPAWQHVELVYNLLIRIAESKALDIEVALQSLTPRFAEQLVELFCSQDPRERDMLKTAVHRIYGRFMKLRLPIRKAFNQMLLAYSFGTHFYGVAEVLEFLGCIINGFTKPLKEEHRDTLVNIFLPLHRHKSMAVYHPQLKYCVTQFLGKAPDLVEPVIRYLIKYWPKAAAQKQVLFLNQVDEIMGQVDYNEFMVVAPLVFKKLGACMENPHFMIAERALQVWNQEHMLEWMRENTAERFPLIAPSVNAGSNRHWSGVVQDSLDRALRTLAEMDPPLYRQYCTDAAPCGSALDQQLAAVAAREGRWAKIEAAAKARAAEIGFTIDLVPSMAVACPDIYMKGENISPNRAGGTGSKMHRRKSVLAVQDLRNPEDVAAAEAEAEADSDDDEGGGEDDVVPPVPPSPSEKSFVRRKSMLPTDLQVKRALESYEAHDLTTPSESGSGEAESAGGGDGADSDDDSGDGSSSKSYASTHDTPDVGASPGGGGGGDAQFDGFGADADSSAADAAGAGAGGVKRRGRGVDHPCTKGCWLTKRKSGTFGRTRRRWFAIDVDTHAIVYYVEEPAVGEEPRGRIPLNSDVKVTASGKQLVVHTPSRTFSLAATKSLVPIEWEKTLTRLLHSPRPHKPSATGSEFSGFGDGGSLRGSADGTVATAAEAEAWYVGDAGKDEVMAAVAAANQGDFLVRIAEQGVVLVVCINAAGTAIEFPYHRNGRGGFVYGGEELLDSAALVDKMRSSPPTDGAGNKLWLQDAAPIVQRLSAASSFDGFEEESDGTIDI